MVFKLSVAEIENTLTYCFAISILKLEAIIIGIFMEEFLEKYYPSILTSLNISININQMTAQKSRIYSEQYPTPLIW
ncbi:hypothetical protein V1503_11725 [Bacillus sp. SCS-151]|uniref:hypothetical protein n=1 Tax=Nanhaiella sioensis TaxID=3115293 RepID=UPI00397855CE